MKKIFCFVFLLIFLLVGCSNKSEQVVAPENTLTEYLSNMESYQPPVQDFGEPTNYVDMTDHIVIGILYPQTEFSALDFAINDWIYRTAVTYKNEAAEIQDATESAELSATYESAIVSDSYAYIKFTGLYSSPALAHPVEICKTFNIDIRSGKLLTLEDIFTQQGIKDFKENIVKTAKIDSFLIDDNIADNFVLKKSGIEITLVQGEYLPMSDGTKTYLFSYSYAKDFLADSFDFNPDSEKKPVATTPSATPDATPDKPKATQTAKPKQTSQGRKMIALTFDDGPGIHTARLLDLFQKYGGKGTFFVLGNLIDRRPEVLVRMRNEGHQIASHGWDHRQLTKLNRQNIKNQLMMTRAKIYDVTGVDPLIMRPPYGSCNDTVKAVGKELGISFVNWSVDTLDWKTKNVNSIYNEIVKSSKNGSIILCHDIYGTTVDAMEKVIPMLIEEGYELVTIDELMAVSGGLEPGKLYYMQ